MHVLPYPVQAAALKAQTLPTMLSVAAAFHRNAGGLAGVEIRTLSGKALEWVWSLRLPAVQKSVLYALAGYHSRKHPDPYPSMETLADKSGVSIRTAARTIVQLEQGGFVTVDHSAGRSSNRYRLNYKSAETIKPGHSDIVGQPEPGHSDTVKTSQPGHSVRQPGHSVTPTRSQWHTNKGYEQGNNKGVRKRATPAPEKLSVTESMQQWASKTTPGVNLKIETDRFLDYHRAKGTQFKDWTAAWRNWMRKAVEFQQAKPQRQDADLGDPYTEAVARSTTP